MFSEVENLRRVMAPFAGDYWVAGGWAVDMFLGRKTRDHKDIEAAIRREDQKSLLSLPGLARAVYAHDGAFHAWEGERLSLPLHVVFLYFDDGAEVEILLNEFEGNDWVYRRNLAVRRAAGDFVRGEALPVEIALLYKSKNPREADEQDFALAAPELREGQRKWLSQAISRDYPVHPWLASLA